MSGAAARIAAVGVSIQSPCGVRDHATLLAEALGEAGMECSLHWLQRDAGSLRATRDRHAEWLDRLCGELRRKRPDAVLLHYSVFSFSHRGLPLLIHPTIAVLRDTGVPLVVVGHELAFPWRRGGARGMVWALIHRAALIEAMRAASGVVLTADFRVRWLTSRRWLPRRPVALAPVFSNLPSPRVAYAGEGSAVGVFGYRYDRAAIARVLDALVLLRERPPAAHLKLLGAPGRDSPSGQAWLAAARARGIEAAISFSGPLPAQELSDALATCALLVFADTPGPASRKGTLAGALASGRPLVALDGHRRFGELVECGAARIVRPDARALADALGELLGDEGACEALGARGRAFAQERMSLGRTVEAVLGVVGAGLAL